jgi:hypothetical protein
VKLPSASVGFCLNVAAEPGSFVLHHVNLYVDGIEISHPELYNDEDTEEENFHTSRE